MTDRATPAVAGLAAKAGPAKAAALSRRLRTLAPLIVLIVLCIAIGLLNANFFSIANFIRILTLSAVPLVLALGATFVILTGGIDLSVEGTIAVCAIILGLLVANDLGFEGYGIAVGAIVAIAAGALTGAVNGVVHVGLRIPSFMVTLGTWFIGLGLATVLLSGGSVRVLDENVRGLFLTRVLDLPLIVWIAAGAFVVAWVIQDHTRFGRHVMAVGGGEDLAALSGVPVARVKILVFTLAGAFYGLAAIMAVAQLGQGKTDIAGGRLFTAVTAVVVGGTSLVGGEGGVRNTLIGVLIVSVLANGMILLGVPPYAQQGVQGLLIIAAVAMSLDRMHQRIVK